jgi:hypothetical protein
MPIRWMSCYKRMCLEMMPSWCRQVNWGNCGILSVNCAVFCVKDDWKGQFWDLCYYLSKLHSLLSFPSGMMSQSKIAQFNWECIGRFTNYVWQSHNLPLWRHCSASPFARSFGLWFISIRPLEKQRLSNTFRQTYIISNREFMMKSLLSHPPC